MVRQAPASAQRSEIVLQPLLLARTLRIKTGGRPACIGTGVQIRFKRAIETKIFGQQRAVFFQREGENLHCEFPISFAEAVLDSEFYRMFDTFKTTEEKICAVKKY